jgi:hypothetical protein
MHTNVLSCTLARGKEVVYLAVESVLGLKLICDGVVEALLHRHLAVVQSCDKERPEHPEP